MRNIESKRMEALSDLRWRRCGCIIFQLTLIGIVTLLFQSSEATAVGSGSVRAELFHRDHPFSKSRSLSLSGSTSTWETNVTDAAPAEYLMSISLGTPPQNFVAVMDTGSDLTWLQCDPCDNCFSQPSPFFDPRLSSTYQTLNCSSDACSNVQHVCTPDCEYSYYYADNSNTTGTFSLETIHVQSTFGESISVPGFWFGCSHSSYSPTSLYSSSDGLVGLSQGPNSFSSQLGAVFEDKFSYCLVNRSMAGVQSSPLVFGSDAASDLDLQYTPIIKTDVYFYKDFYHVGIEGISVDGVAVDCDVTALAMDPSSGQGGTILDSGTTFTYLNSSVTEPLLTAIDAVLNSSYVRVNPPYGLDWLLLCYDVTGRPNHEIDLPEIRFKLANDTSWDLATENAWISDNSDGDLTVCLTITAGNLAASFSILGNIFQRDFHVLYDRVGQRIGFAKTDCAVV